ncbi:MAG: DUF3426 domain-containing protein [Duganella sp.]
MALATKCPHCNTIFRVAHDQLKIRGGIVRCGSCNEVFDGNAALLEPPGPLPVAAAPEAAAPLPSPVSIPAADMADKFDLDISDLDDFDGDQAPPAAAPATLPESVAALSLDFDDDEPLPRTEPEPEAEPEPELEPIQATEPSPQDLLGSASLSAEELQAALEAELAALDARMAAAQPAPALAPLDEPEPASPATPGDGRREPTFELPERPYELEEDDEAALLQLSAAAQAQSQTAEDDIPPSHTLLRKVSAPAAAAERYYGEEGQDEQQQELHSSTPLADTPAATLDTPAHTLEASPEASAAEPKAEADADTYQEPGFVKRARHRQRYGKAQTIALALGSVLLLAALAGQGLTTFRNQLAASFPALKPTLVAACDMLGCKVELLAQIDELAIEQGELQTLSDTTFSFATALRNQSRHAQAWPHIELVLDDAHDKTVLRRVFAPRDYLAADIAIAEGFPARSEQSVKLYFELKQLKASGYHIAVFYP